jgi:FAD synthase
VANGPVLKAVLSIGYNPQFKGKKKTLEAYFLHKFPSDFYGEEMALLICGFLRPMETYPGIEELKAAIADDVRKGSMALDEEPFVSYRDDPFFARAKM